MYQFNFNENKRLMYVSAKSFPEDIFQAHQLLHSIVIEKENRDYYGISFPDKTGKIQYRAAVTENFKGESAILGLNNYLLKKGKYNYITIPQSKDEISEIEKAFKILLFNPKIKSTTKKI